MSPYRPSVLRFCEHCGSEFSCYAAWVERGGGRFCGQNCRRIAQPAKRGSRTSIVRKCAVCRAPITVYASQANRNASFFCGAACRFLGRFWSKVAKTKACWTHTARPDNDGYIHVGRNGDVILAHRAAWEMEVGPIPDGFLILHTCDTPACVRNDDSGTYELAGTLYPRQGHLWIGTDADNNLDKELKGRAKHPKGANHGLAKLTEAIVLAIRAEYAAGGISQAALAKKYGVIQATISRIIRRVAWAHI